MQVSRSSLPAVLLGLILLRPSVAAQPPRRDLHGDALPAGAVARMGTIRLRQPFVPFALAYAPNGRILASDCFDEIWLWESATGKLLRRIDSQEAGQGSKRCLFLNDKTLMRTVEKSIRQWDVRTGEEVRQIPLPSEVDFLALASDGGLMATGVADQRKRVSFRVWDTSSGKEVGSLAPEGQTCLSLEWIPGTRTLAVCGIGGDAAISLRLWDVATRKQRRIPLPPKSGHSIAYSPDGKTVAVANRAGEILLFDLMSGNESGRLRALHGAAVHLLFSPDGNTLAAAHDSEIVQLWQLATRQPTVRVPGSIGRGRAIAFSPDGKTLATAGQGAELRLWDPATGKEKIPTAQPFVSAWPIAFLDAGKTLLAAGDNRLRYWNAGTGRERKSLRSGEIGYCSLLSPDRKTLALGNNERGLEIWDLATEKKLAGFAFRTEAPEDRFALGARPLAFSPDSTTLAAGDAGGAITIYEANPWKKMRQFSAHAGAVNRGNSSRKTIDALAFAPDGTELAAAGWTWGVRVWDPLTGMLLQDLFHADVNRVVYAPDGRSLVSASHAAAAVWEAATGKRRFTLPAGGEIAFSPDGRLLATVDDDVILWDLITGEKLRPFHDPNRDMLGSALSVIFSPDGQRIAVGYRDASILIWDVASHRSPVQPPALLTRKEAEALWDHELMQDAEEAFQAMRKLALAPQQSLPLLRARLQPMPKAFGAKMKQRIADLKSDSYVLRQKAMTALLAEGAAALPFLTKARKSAASLEACRRMDALLKKMPPPTKEWLRERRGVEILEMVRSAEAQQILHVLADGFPDAELTQEAQAALQRLAQASR